jgi:ABC-type phosphate transport system substrate-binding protein
MTMQRTRLLSALTLCALAVAALVHFGSSPRVRAQSDDSVIIVINARNPTNALSAAEAKKLFLGQTSFWHGVVPVKISTRPDSSSAAKAFYALLGQTPQSFQKQWNELQLAGRGVAPKALASMQDVALAVSQTPGGISFGLASEAWNMQLKGVKIIPIR